MINTRFVKWAEEEDILQEEQAGYKKGYSTIDQLFTLQSLVQKYLSRKKGRYYALFVDFSKAFDSIPHFLLWYKLINSGVHGKTINVLRDMYSKLKSCVRTPEGLTEYFKCNVGTRQGCMMSPFLFSMYIGGLVDMLKENGCQGVYVSEEVPNLMVLLYADNIVNGADTVGRLQHMVNILSDFCGKMGFRCESIKNKDSCV